MKIIRRIKNLWKLSEYEQKKDKDEIRLNKPVESTCKVERRPVIIIPPDQEDPFPPQYAQIDK